MDSRRNLARRSMLAGALTGVFSTIARQALGDEPVVPTVDEELTRAARNAPLNLLFRGSTRMEFDTWRERFSAELERRIGPHRPPESWRPKALSTRSLADFTREEWLLESDGVPSLPLYLLRPDPKRFGAGPYPVVLCVHGHGPYGHESVAGVDDDPKIAENIRQVNYDYARQLVRRGYLTVAPCMTPFGRRLVREGPADRSRYDNQDPCAITFVRLMILGQTLLGANLRDLQWALDYACSRKEADPARIGCVGLSYGGRMTMMAAALDPRIRVAVISGALNVMQERVEHRYSCGAQVIPGLLEIGDTPEIGSLIAPRPCMWEVGSRDPLIDPTWAKRAIARLRRAYRAAGAPQNLHIHHFEGAHRWDGATAYDLLDQNLNPTAPR